MQGFDFESPSSSLGRFCVQVQIRSPLNDTGSAARPGTQGTVKFATETRGLIPIIPCGTARVGVSIISVRQREAEKEQPARQQRRDTTAASRCLSPFTTLMNSLLLLRT